MSHVATITIDNTKVVGALTDYILEVDLSDLPSEFWDVVANGGGDIRVYKDDDTTQLAREVVFCETTGNTGKMFIKYTGTLSASVDTDIHIYADGTSSEPASDSTYGSENVWTNYVAVLHFQDDADDSSPEGNNFTPSGVTYGNGKVTGKAIQFGGGTDNANIAHNSTFARDEVTIQAWLNGTSGTGGRVIWKDVSGNNNGDFQMTDADNTQFQNGSAQVNLSLPFTASAWHFYAMRTDGSNTETWKDDAQVASSTTAWSFALNSLAFYLGNRDSLSSGWAGDMAEFRVCKSKLSDAWLETEYNNANSPSTFYSTAGVASGTTVSVATEVMTLTAVAVSVIVPIVVLAPTDTMTLNEPAVTVEIENPPLSGYTKRQSVTIDNTQIPSDLTDFIITINLADLSKAGADIFDTCQSDGGDIRVTLDDGSTLLPRVIRSIDTGAKTGYIQVLVPGTLSSSVDTELFVWYNGSDTEPSASSDYGANKVFDTLYAYASIDGGASDESGQVSAPTTHGGVTAGGATGINGGSATDFDGTDDRIDLGDGIIGAGDAYMSVFVQRKTASAFVDDMYFLSMADGDGSSNTNQAGIGHLDFPGGTIGAQFLLDRTANENQYVNGETALPTDGSWVKIEIVLDSGGTSRLYVAGSEQATVSFTGDLGDIPTPLEFILGALRHNGAYNSYSDIRIGDVRIRQGLKSADYISTEYTSETSPSTLYSTGDEVEVSGDVTVSVSTETMTLNEIAPTVLVPVLITPATETMTLNEVAVTVDTSASYPTSLVVSDVNNNGATLTWVKGEGSTHTMIVMKEGSAPTGPTDGEKVYNGKGTSVRINHLALGNSYYFRAYANTPTYALGTENEVSTAQTPFNLAVTSQFIFSALHSGGGVEVRRRDDPTTVLVTLSPASIGANDVGSIDAKGNYLAFGAGAYFYIYEFIDENNYTLLVEDNNVGVVQIRATHIDDELEWVYAGEKDTGIIHAYEIGNSFTEFTYTITGGDDIRDIDTSGDQMVVATNSNNFYDVDRSNRTSLSHSVLVNAGSTAEVAQVDDNYFYGGSDATTVTVRDKTSPYTQQYSLTDPGNDVTSISIEDEDWMSVSSDDGKVYVYDRSDYTLEDTITKTHGMEDSWIQDGDLYYTGGLELTTASKLYYRSYLTDSLSSGSAQGEAHISVIAEADTETLTINEITPTVVIPTKVEVATEVLTLSEPAVTVGIVVIVEVETETLVLTEVPLTITGNIYTDKYPINNSVYTDLIT